MNRKPIIIGSGQYNWDVIKVREYPDGFVPAKRNPYIERTVMEEVGGTCGNVMCILSRLGWDSRPQVKLNNNPDEGYKIADSLKSYGCDTQYIKFDEKGGFSGLVCTHRKNRNTGEHELGLKGFGPNNSQFRKITELRLRDEAPMFLDTLTETPDVFFFDHNESGPRYMAKELRRRGVMIYYECENCKDWNKFLKSVDVADIIKFSDENVPDVSFCDDYKNKLFIQTQSSKGMRFSLRGGEWIHIDPVQTENVVDWEGCGDTVSATFLNELYQIGFPKISELTEDDVRLGLGVASEKAALCTQYIGSKTWIKEFEL